MRGVKDKAWVFLKQTQPRILVNQYVSKRKKRKLKLQKYSEDTIIEDKRSLFRLKKENAAIKDRIIRDSKILFDKEDYYKPVRRDNFWNSNCIKLESTGDRNKSLSIKEYLDFIKPYLKVIINNFEKSGIWKIQLTVAINFISSKDIDEERVMPSKSDKIEIMSYDKADKAWKVVVSSLIVFIYGIINAIK